jgi:molybdate transport system substrate-binding protein
VLAANYVFELGLSRLAAALVLGLLIAGTGVAQTSANLRVFSGGAPQAALQRLAPEFERTTGRGVKFTFSLVTDIQRQLSAGEKADVILLPVPLLAASEKTVPLLTKGRMELARVGIGLIVREGTAPPDISTDKAVREMLLGARAIAWSDPGTPVGGHLDHVIDQLGIAEAVRPKLIIKAAIHGGAKLVARGEADFGVYLVSEVQGAEGVTLVGLLPAPYQRYIVYGVGIPADSPAPEAALAFVKFISAPTNGAVWKAAGFELSRK